MIRDDIKDMIKDGWIRKINHPVASVMLMVFLTVVLFADINIWPFCFAISISVQMYFAEHIDFLIPLSDEDRKRRTVIRALFSSLFYTAWLGGLTLIYAFFYHKTMDAPCFYVVLLHICAFLVMLNANMPEPTAIAADFPEKQKSGIGSGTFNGLAVIIVFFMSFLLKNR